MVIYDLISPMILYDVPKCSVAGVQIVAAEESAGLRDK